MNIITFLKQYQRLLIVGAVLLVLGTLYRFYPDLGQFFSQGGDTDTKLKRLTKYYEKIQTRDALQASTIDLTRRVEQAERVLLDAETPSLAAVEIQNILNEIIYGSQMDVVSIRVLQATDGPVEGYLTVPVQLTIKLTVRQILDLLHRIESSQPLLAISAMSVRRQQAQNSDTVHATFTIEGYMKKAAPT